MITSVDDFSRKLLFAALFPAETTWAHIQATQTLIQTFGVPLRFYVDSLLAFRFVQKRQLLAQTCPPDRLCRYPMGQGRETLPLVAGPHRPHLCPGGAR